MIRRLLFHNFKIIFALDYWVKQHFTKPGLLVLGGLITVSVFGIDTHQSLAYQLFTLFSGLLLLAVFSGWLFRGQFKVQRRLPKFATVDEPLTYQITVLNQGGRRQQSLMLRDHVKQNSPHFHTFLHAKEPNDDRRNRFDRYVGYPRWVWLIALSRGADIQPQSLPTLPPKGEAEVNLRLKPLRRGYIYFSHLTFACPDPFGLFYALLRLPHPDKLLILPKHYPLKHLPLPGSRKYQRGGIHLAMSVGDAQEFMALRDYRPGDPLKNIHWKSFARRGKPVVKEFQDEFFIRYALVLDTFTTQPHGQLFEAAVSVAASFALAPRHQDSLLDLMFAGTQAYQLTSGRGLGGTEKLLEVLACVEASQAAQFDNLTALIQQHLAALSGIICVFLAWDEQRQQLVQMLRQHGIPLLAVVVTNRRSVVDTQHFPFVYEVYIDDIATDLEKLALSIS